MTGQSAMRGWRRALTLLSGLALTGAVLGALPDTAEAGALPGANGKIVFRSSPDQFAFNEVDIWTINPDGTDLTRLTDDPAREMDPAWSPDGTRIAYARQPEAGCCLEPQYRFDIWVMNADGTGATNLTAGHSTVGQVDPAWSPDGTRIAMVAEWKLVVMNADGTDPVVLLSPVPTYSPPWAYFGEPAWSPDGSKIAFSSRDNDPGGDIWVMNADGTNLVKLTDGEAADEVQPSWSPDGTKIAYSAWAIGDGDWDIWVMNADGTNRTDLTNNGTSDHEPFWSPDGTKIAYQDNRDAGGDNEIYTINADGSNPTRVTFLGAFAVEPDWQRLPSMTIEGFDAPVDMNGVLNVASAGRTIPLKFSVADADGPVTDLASVAVSVSALSCSLGTTADALEEFSSGDSGLQNLGGGAYQWNWKTPKAYANSCKTLHLVVANGVSLDALFKFIK